MTVVLYYGCFNYLGLENRPGRLFLFTEMNESVIRFYVGATVVALYLFALFSVVLCGFMCCQCYCSIVRQCVLRCVDYVFMVYHSLYPFKLVVIESVVAFHSGERTNLNSAVGVACILSYRACRLVLCFLNGVNKCPALSRGRYPTFSEERS